MPYFQVYQCCRHSRSRGAIASSLHWHAENGKDHVFSTLEPDFCTEMEKNLPPPYALASLGYEHFFFVFGLSVYRDLKTVTISGEDSFFLLVFI